jgi:hypothetical protein
MRGKTHRGSGNERKKDKIKELGWGSTIGKKFNEK